MSNTTEYQYVKKIEERKKKLTEWTNNIAPGYLTTSQTLKRFHFTISLIHLYSSLVFYKYVRNGAGKQTSTETRL